MNFKRIASALILGVLLSAVTLAGVKSRNVTFLNDVSVGGTLVKKGSYKVTFDESTNELTILDGKNVIAKATAKLEEIKKASRFAPVYTTFTDHESASNLASVNLGGSKYAVISSGTTADTAATTGQQ